MSRKWEWDERNPYENAFEESLLSIPGHVVDTVFRKLLEIKKDPTQGEPSLVAGIPIYTVRTEGNGSVPPLLIVYAIDERSSLIRNMWVSRAGSVDEISD